MNVNGMELYRYVMKWAYSFPIYVDGAELYT